MFHVSDEHGAHKKFVLFKVEPQRQHKLRLRLVAVYKLGHDSPVYVNLGPQMTFVQ